MIRLFCIVLLFAIGSCKSQAADQPAHEVDGARARLAVGYSLLYQEADGIPKLKWIFVFKKKTREMDTLTDDLVAYYKQLAASMKKLSEQFPAMRIDVAPMSPIESDTRKAIGEDQAKEFAPLVGKSGIRFERTALLMFYDALNEQRHLTAVMMELETVPALNKFLQDTHAQLDARYRKVGALLERRYFTH